VDGDKLGALAIFLILGSLLAGGAYLWGSSTIIADSSPPEINEAATTHGAIAYGDGRPTLLLFVDENLGIEAAEAEIRTLGGLLGLGSRTVETITLSLDQKMDRDTYKYRGTAKTQLEQNTRYTVVYRVYDQADNGDTWTTTIETVNLDGVVRVNGVEVEGPEDTIYVRSLQLGIEVEITQGESTVQRIYGLVNGETLEFSQTPSGVWITGYELPRDGKYSFLIQVLDTGGTDTRLASFTVELGGGHRTELVILLAGLVAAALLYSMAKQEKKKGGRSR